MTIGKQISYTSFLLTVYFRLQDMRYCTSSTVSIALSLFYFLGICVYVLGYGMGFFGGGYLVGPLSPW
jgi:hypothetical protein